MGEGGPALSIGSGEPVAHLMGPQKLFASHCPSGQEAGGPTHEHGNQGIAFCASCSLPPLEAGEGCSSGHQCRHHCDNAMITTPICAEIHISHRVLLSITSREHMVPIVVEGTFLLGPRRLLFSKSVSNNSLVVCFYSALCFAEHLHVLALSWPAHSFCSPQSKKELCI